MEKACEYVGQRDQQQLDNIQEVTATFQCDEKYWQSLLVKAGFTFDVSRHIYFLPNKEILRDFYIGIGF